VTTDEYGKNHATIYQNMPKKYMYLEIRSELNWNINASYFVSAEITNSNNSSCLNFYSDNKMFSILGYDCIVGNYDTVTSHKMEEHVTEHQYLHNNETHRTGNLTLRNCVTTLFRKKS
jgi:hypothetical protein